MAERLAELDDRRVAGTGWNSLLMLEQLKAQPMPEAPMERARREVELAMLMVLAGEVEGGVQRLEALAASPAAEAMGPALAAARGIAWLRLGEVENCIESHTSAACLVPIRGDGVHRLKSGSERAAEVYAALLEKQPDDLVARWLLNLAHQTLGTWPDGVPVRWLIPPSAFASEAPMPHFRDVAAQAGVDAFGHAGGGVLDDFDGDDLLDLMVSSWRVGDPMHYYVNRGDGRFEERTRAAGLDGLTGGLNMVQADYDEDGDPDVLVLRGGWRGVHGRLPNSLLRNDGGVFVDVTEAAGLLSFRPTQSAAWADFDLDGDDDLFIGNESSGPEDLQPSELFVNRGDGTFAEVAAPAGALVFGFVKGVTAGDYDGDGRPDLYLSRLGQPNVLLRNEGVGEDGLPRFSDATAAAGVGEPVMSFPTMFFDYDGDGDLDLFVVGYGPKAGIRPDQAMTPEFFRQFSTHVVADYLGLESEGESPRLYRNRGDGTFEDVTKAAGLDRRIYAMSANHGDLDNDGRPDLYLGTGDPSLEALLPNRALWNAGDGTFRDVTTAAGVGHVQKGHGISFGDVDNDGDQDVHAVMGGAFEGDVYPNALFENPGHGHRWLKLHLVGTRSSRDALGARVEVEVATPGGGTRTIHDRVSSGGSFGASPLRREIGLGDAVAVRRVTVHWPVGEEPESFPGVLLDQGYRLVEGSGEAKRIELPRFRFPTEAAPKSEHRHTER